MSYPTAAVNDEGDIVCPSCNINIITPMGRNPHKGGQMEKMILSHVFHGTCPRCRTIFYVSKEDAKRHNRYWFPDDPEFA